MRLATRLTILFVAISIVPLSALSYLAYVNSQRALEQSAFNHLISTNDLKEAELERWIESDKRQLQALAQRPLVRVDIAILASHDEADPEFQAANRSLIENHLGPALEAEGGFTEVCVLRASDGLVLASTVEDMEGKYRESEPFFLEGKIDTYAGSVVYSLFREKGVMYISTPVEDDAGNVIAVLAGHADLSEVSEIMSSRSDLIATEDTYLVNKFNFFVTEPKYGQDYALKTAIHTEGVEAGLRGEDGSAHYDDYRGAPVLGAYRWLPERDMVILTEVDEAETFAPVIALRNQIIGIGLAVAALVALLAIIFARTITRPVHQLVRGAEEIGAGNLEYRMEVGGRDEIGQLATAFDEMAASLRRSLGETARSEAQLKAVFESSIAEIIVVDKDYKYLYANQEAIDGARTTRDKVIGKTMREGLEHMPDFMRTWLGRIDRVFQTGESMFVEETMPVGDEFAYREAQLAPIKDADGTIFAVGVITRDVTDRKRTEEELQKSEARFRAVFESSSDFIVVVDREYKYLYANQASIDAAEVTRDKVIGKDIRSVLKHQPDALKHHTKMFGQVLQTNETARIEYTRAVEDELHYRESTVFPIVDADGNTFAAGAITRDVTEHRRAEKELQRREALFEATFESTGDFIIVVDKERNYLYANQASIDAAELTRDKVIGKDIHSVLAHQPWALKHHQSLIGQAFQTNVPLRAEYTRVVEDERLYRESTTFPIVDADGNTFAVGMITRDVTERKRAEEALHESEERYRSIFDTSRDAIVVTSPEGQTLDCNQAMLDLYGYTRKELLGMDNSQRYADLADRERFRKLIRRDGFVQDFEGKYRKKDGTIIDCMVTSTTWRASDGSALYGGFIRDVTDQKQAQEELRKHRDHLEELVGERSAELKESEERYRTLFQESRDAIVFSNPEDRYTDGNQAALDLYGCTREEFLELSISERYVDPADEERHLQEYAEKGYAEDFEVRLRKKDGTEMDCLITSVERRDSDGNLAYRGVIRDITERKRAEENLTRYRRDLERSNEELQQFAYVASHDLQEPLRMVSSYTQLLAKRYQGKLDEDADDFINYAVDGANRMQQLIIDLLSYSRVGTRGKEIQPAETQTALDGALANLQMAIEESGAAVTHDPLPTVMADQSQLVQLFQNLIDNAIKFRGEEPSQVHVGAEQEDHEWLFSVRDNGIGIDPQYRERIFVIFQRLHGREEYPGTGIGLAVCKRIVERHGGRIWVESEPGTGSTFYFTIKAVREG